MKNLILNFKSKKLKKIKNPKILLGGKGANLSEMGKIGLPVPPGFTISTKVCDLFYKNKKKLNSKIVQNIKKELKVIEKESGKKFGDLKNPLLVSVRSGARVSMPGMMDTILNLGLNDKTVLALANKSSNMRFAKDSYRRFIQMYSNVVMGVKSYHFEELIENYKLTKGVLLDTELDENDWDGLIKDFKKVVKEKSNKEFPENVFDQLFGAISAVFLSWESNRAKVYRKLNQIPSDWGTAVNVQSMVFGNMGNDCATGVAFTRDPSTGNNEIYGEYLVNAQGEDVVAGIRTPQPLTLKDKTRGGVKSLAMEEAMPEIYQELQKICANLEAHYRDMQDIEFTVQKGFLWMLQTRNAKRTAQAALKVSVAMAEEGLIDPQEAVMRIEPSSLEQLLHPTLDPAASRVVLARGLAASPGAATGRIVFEADEAERMSHAGEKVLLARVETSPEDIHGMHAAVGILTARGGMTSHAAVVARGMGRPCVSGASEVQIDYSAKTLVVGGKTIKSGETMTIDGSTGEIMEGRVATVQPELGEDFDTFMGWVDECRTLKVRANAETPEDAAIARKFGAEGIGLCRTEHMFFDASRITAMREMIMAKDSDDRSGALAKVQPMQRKDFIELFEIMEGLPVTIRLLDPPLHEFLPKTESEFEEFANSTNTTEIAVKNRATQLHELNPMLGHRGCRLGITHPEIYEMQVRAIFEAAVQVKQRSGKPVHLEIMIPLVATEAELDLVRSRIDGVAKEIKSTLQTEFSYLVGTMVELPRACLSAGSLAKEAEFFSFGTNDLTQTTFGISRDDSGHFLPTYHERNIVEQDPFVSIDEDGVGELIQIAAERGRATRPDIKLGICGEHGGDPSSISFCHKIGLDYVSCSAYRVPIARLAAAQTSIGQITKGD